MLVILAVPFIFLSIFGVTSRNVIARDISRCKAKISIE